MSDSDKEIERLSGWIALIREAAWGSDVSKIVVAMTAKALDGVAPGNRGSEALQAYKIRTEPRRWGPHGVGCRTEDCPHPAHRGAGSDGFRICEFCGCNTNAHRRLCCDAGLAADRKKRDGQK